ALFYHSFRQPPFWLSLSNIFFLTSNISDAPLHIPADEPGLVRAEAVPHHVVAAGGCPGHAVQPGDEPGHALAWNMKIEGGSYLIMIGYTLSIILLVFRHSKSHTYLTTAKE
ncbi:unnamed protein product, partial [Plutella xylostella]